MKNFQKISNKQGITLIALVVTIIILLILSGITISTLLGENGIIQTAQKAKNTWEDVISNEQQEIQTLVNELNNMMNGESGTGEQPGTDQIPTDGSFSEEKGVNTPDLADGALTPIKWIEEPEGSGNYTMVETTPDDPEWYSYTTTDKKWANAITEDGSMWVWIPRYAYQIADNYHTNSATGGTINIEFLKGTTNEGATGKTIVEYNSSTTNNFTQFPNGYVIHPGFEYSSTAPGLWVAKYEASRNNATDTGEGSANTIKIQPGVQSWRNISVSDIYTTCLNYDSTTLENENLNSHMMKDTEWGAAAYLAQSIYGKNKEVWINPNSNYITGQAGNSASSTTSTSAYNSGNGPQASTTGNVYGIYDMSGGAYEYTAAYVANSNNNLNKYGDSLLKGEEYTKDIYEVEASQFGDDRENNYEMAANKYGDAIYETSKYYISDNSSWYENSLYFPYADEPFFMRGGNYAETNNAGPFSLWGDYGGGYDSIGFRVALVLIKNK